MKKIFNFLGLAVGILTVIAGLYIVSGFKASFYGYYPDEASFGADFYTLIFEGVHDAAYNLNTMGHFLVHAFTFISKAIGLLTMGIGGAITCFFGSRIDWGKAKSKAKPGIQMIGESNNPEEKTEPVEDEWVVSETDEEKKTDSVPEEASDTAEEEQTALVPKEVVDSTEEKPAEPEE